MFKHSFGTVLVGLLQYWNLEKKKIHHNSEDMLDLDLKKTNLRRTQRDSEVHLL